MTGVAGENPMRWPVLRYPDGGAAILVPGYGWKRYSGEELADACVAVLSRGDYETTTVQRAILERLCGPERWQQAVAAVETADEYLRDLASLTG